MTELAEAPETPARIVVFAELWSTSCRRIIPQLNFYIPSMGSCVQNFDQPT